MTSKPQAEQPVFHPKLLTTLKGYTASAFLGDLSAGVIVGIVALPLAIAFAIASGVTPDRGLTTVQYRKILQQRYKEARSALKDGRADGEKT